MGASSFETMREGRDAAEAFRQAQADAAWEHGHGGYTGTIAEKREFEIFQVPPRATSAELIRAVSNYSDVIWARRRLEDARRNGWHATEIKDLEKRAGRPATPGKWARHEALLRRMSEVYWDKWGPAVCLELFGRELAREKERLGLKGRRFRVYVFCGMASC